MLSPLLAAATAAATGAAKAAAPAANATTVPLTLPPGFTFQEKSALAQHAGWLTHGLAGLFVIFGILLVVLLAIQTTKQEGLSGTLGGRVETYRRLGFEGQIARITGTVAIAFVVVATLISFTGI